MRGMSGLPHEEHSAVPIFTLGDRLRRAREYAEMTQAELADAIGISQRSVSNYEADETTPRLLPLTAWANVCKVNLEWLAWGDSRGPIPAPENWPPKVVTYSTVFPAWEPARKEGVTAAA